MAKETSLLSGFAPRDQDDLEALLVQCELIDGQRLLSEAEPAAGLYVIDTGKVAVLKRDMGGHEQLITYLEAPALVGELEILSGDVCTATVAAVGAVQARLLPFASFDALLLRGDPAAVRLMRNVARALGMKLAATDEFYVDMAIWR